MAVIATTTSLRFGSVRREPSLRSRHRPWHRAMSVLRGRAPRQGNRAGAVSEKAPALPAPMNVGNFAGDNIPFRYHLLFCVSKVFWAAATIRPLDTTFLSGFDLVSGGVLRILVIYP